MAELERLFELEVSRVASALGWNRAVRLKLALPRNERTTAPSVIRQHLCSFGCPTGDTLDVLLDPQSLAVPGFVSGILVRLPTLVWLFGTVFRRAPADREYLCALGDGSLQDIIAFSAVHPDACRVPDCMFFVTGGYREYKALIASNYPAWEARAATVFWRGSSSGLKRYWPPSGPEDVTWLPRVEFCATARASRCAERLDVGIVRWVQIPDHDVSLSLLSPSLLREAVPREAFAQFKAVIDIDGNSNAWTGLFLSLLGGSCVVKIASEHGFSQWYYDRLLPWVHYVPVQSDLSDLEAAIDWIFTNDRQAREIGEAGRAFANGLDFHAELSTAGDRLIAWRPNC